MNKLRQVNNKPLPETSTAFAADSKELVNTVNIRKSIYELTLQEKEIFIQAILIHEYNVTIKRVIPHWSDWGESTETSCSNLLWSSESGFKNWKQRKL